MDAINSAQTMTSGQEVSAVMPPSQQSAGTPSPGMDEKVTRVIASLARGGGIPEIKSPKNESEDLKELVEKINLQLRQRRISLNFSIDEDTESMVIKVIDANTDEIIRQIPPDAILALRRNLQDWVGAIFDTEA